MDALELAWIAGFFDGEGCVAISVQKQTKMWLELSVQNTYKEAVDRLQEAFPGHYRDFLPRAGRMRVWEWKVTGFYAAAFAEAVLPYALVKREQLRLAVAFYRQPWRRQTPGRGGAVTYRTDVQIAEDLQYAHRIRALKRIS